MITLSFHQTKAEFMVRVASTLLFETLRRHGVRQVVLADFAEKPQYGFTASATNEPVGPRFVRITDLQDGSVEWRSVPYCKCDNPERYRLVERDLLFARTGATTGKTYLVREPEDAVFASYLIRVRPRIGVDARYLYAFFQSDLYWGQVSREKEGSAQPNVNGKKLAALRLPAVDDVLQRAIAQFLSAVRDRQDGQDTPLPAMPPPLTEQRRIVAKIEQLAAKIDEARGLRKQVCEECEGLCRALILGDQVKPVATPMNEVVSLRAPDVAVMPSETYHFGGVYCFGRGVFAGAQKTGAEFSYSRLTRLQAGNFVYPKLMAWEGALAIVPPECDGLVVSTEFPVFELNRERVLPETLDVYFRTPHIWPTLSGASTGTNVRRRRLNPREFLRYEIPLPPMSIQLQLRDVKRRVDQIFQAQRASAAELDALLPAILDKAFKGEL